MIIKVYGAAGTGKTTYLAKTILDNVQSKYMRKVLFISFSNAAIESINEKLNISIKSLTLHSLAKSYCHRFGGRIDELIKNTHRRNPIGFVEQEFSRFCQANKIKYSSLTGSPGEGDQAIAMWQKVLSDYYPSTRDKEYCLSKLIQEDKDSARIIIKWEMWKKEKKVVDFIDMILYAYDNLEDFVSKMVKNKFKYGFFDEAQDFNTIEWEIVDNIINELEYSYIAGDDCQTIYTFKGSNALDFLNHDYDEEVILPKTYRLPSKILEFSQRIVEKMSHKKIKDIEPVKEGGVVEFKSMNMKKIVYSAIKESQEGKSVYVLTRTNQQAQKIIDEMLKLAVIPGVLKSTLIEFYNKDLPNLVRAVQKLKTGRTPSLSELRTLIEYSKDGLEKFGINVQELKKIISSMQRKKNTQSNLILAEFLSFIRKINWDVMIRKSSNQKLSRILAFCPDISKFTILDNLYIDTFHSSKGLEADVVYFVDAWVHPDNLKNGVEYIDSELRVCYVGATRSKEKLYIVECTALGKEFLSAVL